MVSPGRINVMSPEVMAMDPKMRVGMIGLISARAATVVDRVPPTLNEKNMDRLFNDDPVSSDNSWQ